MNQKISRFDSIQELQESIDKRINDIDNKLEIGRLFHLTAEWELWKVSLFRVNV